jgi:S1-C subfamily serine protease
VYQRALPATAWVLASSGGKGTGWLLDRDRRLLVTNYHVVGESLAVDAVFPVVEKGALLADRGWYLANLHRLKQDGHAVAGRLLRRDKRCDLALIELETIPAGALALPLAAHGPYPGERVHSIGNRRDLDVLWVYTQGSVRQVYRTQEGYFWRGLHLGKGAHLVVTQSPINEGDSGGALLNDAGEVVGVAAAVRWQVPLACVCIEVQEVRALAELPPRPERPVPKAGDRLSGKEVYAQTLRAVALVRTPSSSSRATGWVVDRARKLLVTAYHVVGNQDRIEVTFPVYQAGRPVVEYAHYRDQRPRLKESGHATRGNVLWKDARRNLALVELETLPKDVVELSLADTAPRPGETTHCVGNPNNIEALWVYTAGSVRQLGRANLGNSTDPPDPQVIVVQAPLNDGDHGAPVVNDQGRLIGVTAGKDAPQQLVSYCVAVSEVKELLADARALWGPRSAAEYQQRGRHFLALRRLDRAIAALDRAIELDATRASAWSDRGAAHLLHGDAERAVADCSAALRLQPRLTEALCGRALACIARGDLVKALADCTEALRLEPSCATALSVRGEIRRRQGNLDAALADGDEATRLDRRLPLAFYHRGLTWADRGDAARALADFGEAIRLDSRDVRAHLARAGEYVRAEEWEKAAADYAAALRLQDDRPAPILQEIERRAADLCRGERPRWIGCAELCQRSFKAVATVFEDRPEVQKTVATALAAAQRESDPRKRALALRAALQELTNRLTAGKP